MRWTSLFLALVVVALLAPAAAEPADDDPIARVVFPPELVMRYSREIGLDEHQRVAIMEAIQNAQSKFVDVQWDVQAETRKLAKLLQAKPVDEPSVLVQVDKVLSFEREVKRTQIALLVRIKNLLTEAQQTKLMALRQQGER